MEVMLELFMFVGFFFFESFSFKDLKFVCVFFRSWDNFFILFLSDLELNNILRFILKLNSKVLKEVIVEFEGRRRELNVRVICLLVEIVYKEIIVNL